MFAGTFNSYTDLCLFVNVTDEVLLQTWACFPDATDIFACLHTLTTGPARHLICSAEADEAAWNNPLRIHKDSLLYVPLPAYTSHGYICAANMGLFGR